jgi:hypothetical protein
MKTTIQLRIMYTSTLLVVMLLLCTLRTNGQTNKDKRDTSVYTQVYTLESKECKDQPESISEGEYFAKSCQGYGGYRLLLTGSDYRVNYAIEHPASRFLVYFFPLETGSAQRYERADQYNSKPANTIEWLLVNGKPFAVCIHMLFYKNVGSVKTFTNVKNKVAEFIFVRGLAGYEYIQYDVVTTNTAFNPDEQARYLAYQAFENPVKNK